MSFNTGYILIQDSFNTGYMSFNTGYMSFNTGYRHEF